VPVKAIHSMTSSTQLMRCNPQAWAEERPEHLGRIIDWQRCCQKVWGKLLIISIGQRYRYCVAIGPAIFRNLHKMRKNCQGVLDWGLPIIWRVIDIALPPG